jgi:hypothetical protein
MSLTLSIAFATIPVRIIADNNGKRGTVLARESGEGSWTIEFEGPITVTDRDGRRYCEYARQTWRFSQDNGFVLNIEFGQEEEPRVTLAGNDKTGAGVIGETIASTIRSTAIQRGTREGREEP